MGCLVEEGGVEAAVPDVRILGTAPDKQPGIQVIQSLLVLRSIRRLCSFFSGERERARAREEEKGRVRLIE